MKAEQRAPRRGTLTPAFDVQAVRDQFTALSQLVHGNPLVFLDSAASALKPKPVIDAMSEFYGRDYSNIHRAVHSLSERSTLAFEGARETVARFVNAPETAEVIFVRGTTEGINLVAQSYGRPRLRPEDEVLITGLEHHSNIVPWHLLCEQTGARLVVAPIQPNGEVLLADVLSRIGKKTRIVSIAHVSNALGTVLPVKEICAAARLAGAVTIVDGAQAVPHLEVDVQAIGCDFYAFSSHKLYGPSGIGVLWGRRALFDQMAPYQGGGDMIRSVTLEASTYADIPHKFEAGTPHIAGAVGLGAAIRFYHGIGPAVHAHEAALLDYATNAVASVPGVRLVGTAPDKVAVVSFVMEGAHPHDIGTILDREGVAVRTGHHCAQPVMKAFGVPATVRASLGMYNHRADIDVLVRGLEKVREFFA